MPAERSSLIGRRRELSDLRRLLAEFRLVTLSGPGGVGKTRLATRAAGDLHRAFPDGVAFVDLAAVRDPALVTQQVARAVGVLDTSGRWLVAGVTEVVGQRSVLLVLDNCEHVRDAAALLVDALLAACPQLRVLATSRQPLEVDGESVLVVPPLAVPGDDSPHPLSYESVQLLVERARAARPTLELHGSDLRVAAELCRRLDGIPLAIELAAVRLRTLAPADVLARLDDRFDLLHRQGSAVPKRHRALRATMEWSLGLLSEPERVLWRRAAVFAGAFGLTAAESVCADAALPRDTVLNALTGLVDSSVLSIDDHAEGTGFSMLTTVHAFGLELLERSGERETLRRRHRDWCARLTLELTEQIVGPEQVSVFNALADMHAELEAALDFCLGTPGEAEVGLRLSASLWLYWQARGHLTEGRRWLDALLAATPDSAPGRAHGLTAAGYLALAASDQEAALQLLQEGAALAHSSDQPFVVALATQYLGLAALFGGELSRADHLFRDAAEQHRRLDPRYAAFCLADAGVTALFSGDLPRAEAAFEQSLVLNRGGDPWTRSHALWGLGLVHLTRHAPTIALPLEREALQLMGDVDDPHGIALCLEALAWAAASVEDHEGCARLSGAAEAVWRSIPARPPAPLTPLYEEHLADAGRSLGEHRWSLLCAEGASLSRTEAMALAVGTRQRMAAPSPRPDTRAQLTPRQLEVARLVAEGLTDREIADRLVISRRTAESHVQQILHRIGARTRAGIASWTTANGRVDPPASGTSRAR